MEETFLEILLSGIEMSVTILKTVFLALATYWSIFRIENKKDNKIIKKIGGYLVIIMISLLCGVLRYETNLWISTICLILLISITYSRENFTKSIMLTIISLSINYAIMIFAIVIDFLITVFMGTKSDYIDLAIIVIIHSILLFGFFQIKRFKYGFSFLQKKNENIDLIMLNVSITILLILILNSYTDNGLVSHTFACLIMFTIMMVIAIQKSIQIYYKQKLLEKELSETKEELGNEKQKNTDLENENLSFKEKIHSIEHKQKSLENKFKQISANMEIAEEIDIRDRLNKISKELHEPKAKVELTQTGVANIDDILQYMQSECEKNNIEFNLKIIGNIFYMTNNLISKDDLEILLADHIKNAIIAINHTININRSILVKLGKLSTNYGLYIYDSGVQFEKEVIENLGKKPITTHEDEGGTGIGFMNTFSILRKYNASLYIKEIGEPTKDNFTKIIMIEFDNKKEFKIIK